MPTNFNEQNSENFDPRMCVTAQKLNYVYRNQYVTEHVFFFRQKNGHACNHNLISIDFESFVVDFI